MSLITANECPAPAPTRTATELDGIGRNSGSKTFSVFPLPQFPCSFQPQHNTAPSSIKLNYYYRIYTI